MLAAYNFCEENLTNYEKTILRLAISFGAGGSYVLEESDIIDLSNLLEINYKDLEKALHTSENDVDDFSGIKFGDTIYMGDFLSDNYLFIVIVDFSFIFKSLSHISYENDKQHIKSNIKLFERILFNFEEINSTTATYECIYHNYFSLNFTMYSNSDFHPMDSL